MPPRNASTSRRAQLCGPLSGIFTRDSTGSAKRSGFGCWRRSTSSYRKSPNGLLRMWNGRSGKFGPADAEEDGERRLNDRVGHIVSGRGPDRDGAAGIGSACGHRAWRTDAAALDRLVRVAPRARSTQKLATQEALFPAEQAVAFGPEYARVAAAFYQQVSRARSREIDLAIGACAILQEAELWTMNTKGFCDIPGLRLRELP